MELEDSKHLREFNAWRKEKAETIPDVANRVFALREVLYKGCGFHWSLEKRLGAVIRDLNDFDSSYFDYPDRVLVKVLYEAFIKSLERIEEEALKKELEEMSTELEDLFK